jgi:hypothetical protein
MLIQIYNFLKNLNLFHKKKNKSKKNILNLKFLLKKEIEKKNEKIKKNIFSYFLNICEFLNLINE